MAKGAWTEEKLDSAFPASRTSHSAVLIGDKMVVFGGYGQLIPKESAGRLEDNGAGLTSRQYGNSNDICLIDLQTFKADWLQPAPSLRARNRVGHAAVQIEGDMYAFGGWANAKEKYLNYGFLFDIKSHQLIPENNIDRTAPPGRRDHSLTLAGPKVYLFGGWSGVRSYNDLWSLNYKRSWEWREQVSLGHIPTPRRGHSATAVDDKVYVFGGIYGYTRFFNDLYVLDTKSMEWRILEAKGGGPSPSPRAWHSAVRLPDTPFIVVFGGSGGRDAFQNDSYVFNTVTHKWSAMATSGIAPSPRCSHSAVVFGKQVFVYGGLSCQDGELKPSADLHILKVELNDEDAKNASAALPAAAAEGKVKAKESSSNSEEEDDDAKAKSKSQVENSMIFMEKHKESFGAGAGAAAAAAATAARTTPTSKLFGWLSTRHLRKNTVKRSYFKIAGDMLRCLDWTILATLELDTADLRVEVCQQTDPLERLTDPIVMLLSQTEASQRVKDFLKFAKEKLCDEYPEFYLAVDSLQRLTPGSEEYGSEAKRIFDTYLKQGGERMLSNVSRPICRNIKKALENNKIPDGLFDKAVQRAVVEMRVQLSDFFNSRLELKMTSLDKLKRTCNNCHVKFNDMKLEKRLCSYCLGLFCADCFGSESATLPKDYLLTEPQPCCDTCCAILTNHLSTFRVSGYKARKEGLYAPQKDSKSGAATSSSKNNNANLTPTPPFSVVMGANGEAERNAWLEALRNASVKNTDANSTSRPRKEGWMACKPLTYQGKKNKTVTVWTKNYLILDGSVLRILRVAFKEALPLVGWDVHNFNKIEPTLTGDGCPEWMPTESKCAYQFSISNRNNMFKLGADSSAERFEWITSLQRRHIAEGEEKRGE